MGFFNFHSNFKKSRRNNATANEQHKREQTTQPRTNYATANGRSQLGCSLGVALFVRGCVVRSQLRWSLYFFMPSLIASLTIDMTAGWMATASVLQHLPKSHVTTKGRKQMGVDCRQTFSKNFENLIRKSFGFGWGGKAPPDPP